MTTSHDPTLQSPAAPADTGAAGNRPGGGLSLSDEEFGAIRQLVYSRFGINLTEHKRSLVTGRLQKVLRRHGFATFEDFLHRIETDRTGRALDELANRISTNHTYFNRENDHFEFFADKVLPEIVERHNRRRDRDIRLWSAGCSSGEESYNLVMTMLEYFGDNYGQWDAGLLATDISADALATARRGVYGDDRLKSMPMAVKRKYFHSRPGDRWEVTDRVKREVTFRRFNLMNETFPFRRPFDAIFCRNVMIYFDRPTREALVKRFYEYTEPGGYLFIGHSESLDRTTCPYRYIRPAVYRRID